MKKFKPISEWSRLVQHKEKQMLKAENQPKKGRWHGLGMFGVIGWGIVVPTLVGIFIGVWLDKIFDGVQSWTLSLMLAGLIFGCYNVWVYLSKEDKEINKNREDENE